MAQNKTLTRILLFVLLAIWGTVAYKVIAAISSGSEDESGPTAVREPAATAAPPFVYRADVRDPFRVATAEGTGSGNRIVKPKPVVVWTPPPVKLTGILAGKKKRTAMVQTAEGSSYFLAEGDTLKGMKVLKIDPYKVSYLFMKKKSEFLLEH